MGRLWAVLTLWALVGACSPADTHPVDAAQEPAPAAETAVADPQAEEAIAPNRIAPLREALQAMVAAQQYAEAAPPAPILDEELAAIRGEVAGLRQEVADLRSELNEYLEELLQGLQKENERLRDEILRLSARVGEADGARPRVPAPGDDFVDEVVEERLQPKPEPGTGPAETAEAPEPAGPTQPFVFTSVKEWGRSPEEAAKAPGGARSLFGMIGTVPSGSRESDLIGLAQELRERYSGYDNINVEVFDNAEAAQVYAENRTMDAARHVLSVSKHADSGRDIILIFRDGVPIDVTPGKKIEPLAQPTGPAQ